MRRTIRNRMSQMREIDLDFRLSPLQRSDKVLDRPRVHARTQIPEHEFAQQFVLAISCPRINRDPEYLLMHVDESRLLVPRLELVRDPHGRPEGHGRFVLESGPLEEFEIGLHGAVVAVDFGVDFVRLHESAGLEVVEALLYYLAEVGEDAGGHAGVDEVVGLGAVPPFFAADVVDEEIDVGGGAKIYEHMLECTSGEGRGTCRAGWGRDLCLRSAAGLN